VAEPEGFEPSIPGKRYAALAKRCLQPLGHSSIIVDMHDAVARRKRWIGQSDASPEIRLENSHEKPGRVNPARRPLHYNEAWPAAGSVPMASRVQSLFRPRMSWK
jgi:hypothetical protein